MPVMKRKPDTVIDEDKKALPVGNVIAQKKIYNTATQNNAISPPESLVLYMEGMPWTVDYFSQMLGEHDDVREVDIGHNAALQQYRKLNNIELRVQSELADNYDQDTGRNTVQGTAIAIGMIPNAFDYFVTEAGTRGRGLFMVTTSTRKIYLDQSVYEIDYVLIGYIDSDGAKDRYEALVGRTVQEFHYHKERVQAGQVALLTTEEHGDVQNLAKLYAMMTKTFYLSFLHHDNRLICAPGSDRCYDPRLAQFALATSDPAIWPEIDRIQRLSYDRDQFLSLPSIWTALMMRDVTMLPMLIPKVSKVTRSFFGLNSFLTSTNCWSMDTFIYPDIASVQLIYPRLSVGDRSYGWLGEYSGVANQGTATLTRYADRDIPIIYEANKEGFYILSEAFYKQQLDQMSLLELLTVSYLKGETLNLNHLALLCSSWNGWDVYERFYFTPLLMCLIKEAIAGYY